MPEDLDFADPMAPTPEARMETAELFAAIAELPDDFRDALVAIEAGGGPKRKLVGLEMIERGIARDGYKVLNLQGEAVGEHQATLGVGVEHLDGGAVAAPGEHFGIVVESAEDVEAQLDRLEAAGYPVDVEREETCCYANQTKVWASDPEGRRWETYVVHEDTEERDDEDTSCCTDPAASSNGRIRATT